MIAGFLLLQAAATAAPAPAPWAIRERVDTATGTKSTSATVTAADGSSRLIVKCDKGVESIVSIQFIAKQALQVAGADGGFADKPVGLRFDGGAAAGYDWEFRSAAAFVSDSAIVTELTVGLARAKSIKVETTTAANFRFEASFAGPPSDAPIRQILSACGYTLGQVPALPPVAPASAK